MAETIGSLLEKTRVAKGLTPEQVTAKTRISATFIRAVEADRFDDLPGKVVVRGFLKTYANLLGLDAEEVLAHYDEMGITTVDKSPELISMPLNRSPLGPKVALYGGATLLAALLVSVYFFFGAPPPVGVTVAPSHGTQESDLQEATTAETTDVETETTDMESAKDEPVTTEPAKTEPAKTEPTPEETPATSTNATAEDETDPLKDARRPHKLSITATADSWLKVIVDGDDTREIILRADKSVVWYAEKGFTLNIGNVAGVTVRYNNEAAPLPEAPRNILTNLHYPSR